MVFLLRTGTRLLINTHPGAELSSKFAEIGDIGGNPAASHSRAFVAKRGTDPSF
jgi:hypothetical protein